MMQPRLKSPTTTDNLGARLFLRFFLCYFVGCLVALVLFRGFAPPNAEGLGACLSLSVPLAALGGILTLSKPYLLLLTLFRSALDAQLLSMLFAGMRAGYGGIFTFNAYLCYLAFSVLLYCVTAARACRFCAENTAKRDAALLFSRPFWAFVGESLLLFALSMLLYLLWPQLLGMLSS